MAPTCFEGERVTPIQGEDYAPHSPCAPNCSRFCFGRTPFLSTDSFSDPVSAELACNGNEPKQTKSE